MARWRCNLGQLRRERGLTQSDVADSIGVTAGYYARVEQGHHRLSDGRVLRLCEALGVSPRELSWTRLAT